MSDDKEERQWIASMEGREIAVSNQQLDAFRQFYLEKEISSRVSDLIILDMCVLNMISGIAPQEVLASMKSLEEDELSGNTKAATQFKNSPLKGLWHKHYFSARFVPRNIRLALGKTD
ncbi:hypothetical protein EYE42_04095 [Paracoccus subflavus]|uniref:Uncharacterized protein n=1 Tax=Paracoccus subflavus TaxID=2528244 RepID=A0A4Q9G5U8_9RHOB|nr:hypothetical protein [Paracoccus subflavus]TBN42613.1 hypothetical protein EYE42_04095 [Paracoccus subflavus]